MRTQNLFFVLLLFLVVSMSVIISFLTNFRKQECPNTQIPLKTKEELDANLAGNERNNTHNNTKIHPFSHHNQTSNSTIQNHSFSLHNQTSNSTFQNLSSSNLFEIPEPNVGQKICHDRVNKQDSPGLLVFGFHHSGTSITTLFLRLLGVYLGTDDELLFYSKNPLKFFERKDVIKNNDFLLGKSIEFETKCWGMYFQSNLSRVSTDDLLKWKTKLNQTIGSSFPLHRILFPSFYTKKRK